MTTGAAKLPSARFNVEVPLNVRLPTGAAAVPIEPARSPL